MSTTIIRTGYPIIRDCETEGARQDYVALLREVAALYNLKGMPADPSELFDSSYTLPDDVPVREVPDYVFIRYPQRPKPSKHDFSKAQLSLDPSVSPYRQLGPVNVLFNEDFTIVFGRIERTKPGYGYGLVLLRNDELRIYTTRYAIYSVKDGPKPYYVKHSSFLRDLQELVILALYRDQYRYRLKKYCRENTEIARYLDCGYIEHQFRVVTGKFSPITCFECKEAKYVNHKAKLDTYPRTPCGSCHREWKERVGKSAQVMVAGVVAHPTANASPRVPDAEPTAPI